MIRDKTLLKLMNVVNKEQFIQWMFCMNIDHFSNRRKTENWWIKYSDNAHEMYCAFVQKDEATLQLAQRFYSSSSNGISFIISLKYRLGRSEISISSPRHRSGCLPGIWIQWDLAFDNVSYRDILWQPVEFLVRTCKSWCHS